MLFPCKFDSTLPSFGLCQSCIGNIETVAILSAQNMGTPEVFGCSMCGMWLTNNDYFNHPCVTNAGT